MKNYKKLLQDAKPKDVSAIVNEMIEAGIELEDVADIQKDRKLYDKVAMAMVGRNLQEVNDEIDAIPTITVEE